MFLENYNQVCDHITDRIRFITQYLPILIFVLSNFFEWKRHCYASVCVGNWMATLHPQRRIDIQCLTQVTKWKHFPRYWTFLWGIHWSPVNSPHKGQWRGALLFSLSCTWIKGWVNNHEAGDLRRHYAHYDVTVMISKFTTWQIDVEFSQSAVKHLSRSSHYPLSRRVYRWDSRFPKSFVCPTQHEIWLTCGIKTQFSISCVIQAS